MARSLLSMGTILNSSGFALLTLSLVLLPSSLAMGVPIPATCKNVPACAFDSETGFCTDGGANCDAGNPACKCKSTSEGCLCSP